MGERGPAPRIFNWDEIDKLISFQCTQEEVAAFFDTSVNTLERACLTQRGVKLGELWDKKRLFGRVRVRKALYKIAEGGGPGAAAVAIYLDKRILGHEIAAGSPAHPGAANAGLSAAPTVRTFPDFCTTAGYPAPFQKQVEMFEFGMQSGAPRILLGARGYGKTDYWTVLGNAYKVYREGLDSSILILSESKARNSAIIEEIANALESNGVELDKRNSTCIRVKGRIGKDHSVEALTIGSSFRGRHPHDITMDDVVTEGHTGEARRKLTKKKYDEAYKLCRNIILIGQPAHAFDLYAELRPKLKKLEIPHGSIPELDADLEAMRLAGVDQRSIEMSYHLRIPKAGSSIFGNLKYIDAFPTGASVAFIDPSDGGDYTAISIIRAFGEGVAVQGHVWQMPWYHTLDELVPKLLAHGVARVAFETNKHGNQPIEQLGKVLSPHGIGVVGYFSLSNKNAAIVSAGAIAHMIHLSQGSDALYTGGVVQYEKGSKYDDAPDSLARGLEWLGLIRGK